RLVSLHQPHVRPIVRGRLGHPVEFGAKFSVALVDGIACVDTLHWDAFSESRDLIGQCQAYRRRYGVWPDKVLADGVYGTLANRRWLKQHGIAFGGKPLGRPPKLSPEQRRILKQKHRADARNRIPIEGKFGQGKAAYGLARIAARRPDTSQAWIRSIFLVMNLITLQRLLLLWLVIMWACVEEIEHGRTLQQGLLDQPIRDRRDAQLALAAVGLGYADSAYRLGPVVAVAQLFSNRRPGGFEVGAGLGNVQAVHARRATVGLDAFPCALQVVSCKHPFEQGLRCAAGERTRVSRFIAGLYTPGFTVCVMPRLVVASI